MGYLSRQEIEKINLCELKGYQRAIKITILLFLFLIALAFIISNAIAADVTLAWDANEPAPDGYRLYQRMENGAYNYQEPVCETKDTTCTITGLLPGNQYYYVVRAFVADNSSGDSNEVGFLPDILPPANLRINIEISVYIDVNGVPYVALKKTDREVIPAQ